jgi:hypothetical protein
MNAAASGSSIPVSKKTRTALDALQLLSTPQGPCHAVHRSSSATYQAGSEIRESVQELGFDVTSERSQRRSNVPGRKPDPMLAVRRPADKADRLLRATQLRRSVFLMAIQTEHPEARRRECRHRKAALRVSIVVCLR